MFNRSASFSSSATNDVVDGELLKLDEVETILRDVKADNIKVIPIPKHCDFVDFMVIATGRSTWHVRNIAQALIYKVKQKQKGSKRMLLPSVEGQEGGNWIVIDSVCSTCKKFATTCSFCLLRQLSLAEVPDNE